MWKVVFTLEYEDPKHIVDDFLRLHQPPLVWLRNVKIIRLKSEKRGDV